ncbi:MAG TPA: DUF3343 domain-containing protein [Anaerolineae bacterium]|nr:DUF3343 domain-containing protein [Anaerolineae bacterium]HOQ97642.1 DUF3343 domain-containing protein [Anaerolineae bacterium]HPL28677.1 DUF3343 domain-containing protein [Anaerolineae bacterium]
MACPQTKATAYAVVLLSGTSHALRAEKVLQQAGIVCKLIPVPRHLSSDCGVCLRIAQGDAEAARTALAAARVEVAAIQML